MEEVLFFFLDFSLDFTPLYICMCLLRKIDCFNGISVAFFATPKFLCFDVFGPLERIWLTFKCMIN